MYQQNDQNRFAIQGQADQLEDDIQGRLQNRTHLIQLYCSDPEEAPRLISEPHARGIPIMVIINNTSSCICKMNIPNGMFTLE